VSWTGSGSSATIGHGLSATPKMIIAKNRSDGGQFWAVYHASLSGANKYLVLDQNSSAQSGTAIWNSTHPTSSVFSVANHGTTNENGVTYASWNWLAGGTASSNTDGSITSSVSANTTSGFSIVSYTGTGSAATVGHGLGVAPKMILFKNRTTASNWLVYHEAIGNTHNLYLDANNAKADRSDTFNDTSPTSSVFTVGTADLNTSGNSIIAYCFAEKKGFSKFSSFVGNGTNDGSYIHLGFKPAFILLKNTSVSASWLINDNKRNGFNPNSRTITPNNSEVENTGTDRTDFLSNGFKLRVGSSTAWNGSGNTISYMAFAENPFVSSSGVPATAR
jgi:hypothetical protein